MTLTIYDMLGQRERTFSMRGTPAGYHSVTWDATNDLGQQIGVGAYLRRIGSFVMYEVNGQEPYIEPVFLLYKNGQKKCKTYTINCFIIFSIKHKRGLVCLI